MMLVVVTTLGLTHRVDIGQAGTVIVDQGVSQLGCAAQRVEHVHDGSSNLGHSAIVGWGGVDDLVQQGTDDTGVVACTNIKY